jgi:nicotinamidase-related amidase
MRWRPWCERAIIVASLVYKESGMRVACERDQAYDFIPGKTALLSIDYQRDFLQVGGLCDKRGLPITKLKRTLEPASKVLETARAAGMTIIHTRECYAADLSDLNAFRRARDTIIGADGPLGRFLIRGEAGTAIVDEMSPRSGESVIDKAGFSAFHGTELDALLKRNGVTHVVIMGVTTQVCVASTLRATVDHGYFPLLLSDCCAAWDALDHEATIRVIYTENHQFGWVSDSRRFLLSLRT